MLIFFLAVLPLSLARIVVDENVTVTYYGEYLASNPRDLPTFGETTSVESLQGVLGRGEVDGKFCFAAGLVDAGTVAPTYVQGDTPDTVNVTVTSAFDTAAAYSLRQNEGNEGWDWRAFPMLPLSEKQYRFFMSLRRKSLLSNGAPVAKDSEVRDFDYVRSRGGSTQTADAILAENVFLNAAFRSLSSTLGVTQYNGDGGEAPSAVVSSSVGGFVIGSAPDFFGLVTNIPAGKDGDLYSLQGTAYCAMSATSFDLSVFLVDSSVMGGSDTPQSGVAALSTYRFSNEVPPMSPLVDDINAFFANMQNSKLSCDNMRTSVLPFFEISLKALPDAVKSLIPKGSYMGVYSYLTYTSLPASGVIIESFLQLLVFYDGAWQYRVIAQDVTGYYSLDFSKVMVQEIEMGRRKLGTVEKAAEMPGKVRLLITATIGAGTKDSPFATELIVVERNVAAINFAFFENTIPAGQKLPTGSLPDETWLATLLATPSMFATPPVFDPAAEAVDIFLKKRVVFDDFSKDVIDSTTISDMKDPEYFLESFAANEAEQTDVQERIQLFQNSASSFTEFGSATAVVTSCNADEVCYVFISDSSSETLLSPTKLPRIAVFTTSYNATGFAKPNTNFYSGRDDATGLRTSSIFTLVDVITVDDTAKGVVVTGLQLSEGATVSEGTPTSLFALLSDGRFVVLSYSVTNIPPPPPTEAPPTPEPIAPTAEPTVNPDTEAPEVVEDTSSPSEGTVFRTFYGDNRQNGASDLYRFNTIAVLEASNGLEEETSSVLGRVEAAMAVFATTVPKTLLADGVKEDSKNVAIYLRSRPAEKGEGDLSGNKVVTREDAVVSNPFLKLTLPVAPNSWFITDQPCPKQNESAQIVPFDPDSCFLASFTPCQSVGDMQYKAGYSIAKGTSRFITNAGTTDATTNDFIGDFTMPDVPLNGVRSVIGKAMYFAGLCANIVPIYKDGLEEALQASTNQALRGETVVPPTIAASPSMDYRLLGTADSFEVSFARHSTTDNGTQSRDVVVTIANRSPDSLHRLVVFWERDCPEGGALEVGSGSLMLLSKPNTRMSQVYSVPATFPTYYQSALILAGTPKDGTANFSMGSATSIMDVFTPTAINGATVVCKPIGVGDECVAAPCGPLATCFDHSLTTTEDYLCSCVSGYHGSEVIGGVPVCEEHEEDSQLVHIIVIAACGVLLVLLLLAGYFVVRVFTKQKRMDKALLADTDNNSVLSFNIRNCKELVSDVNNGYAVNNRDTSTELATLHDTDFGTDPNRISGLRDRLRDAAGCGEQLEDNSKKLMQDAECLL